MQNFTGACKPIIGTSFALFIRFARDVAETIEDKITNTIENDLNKNGN